MGKRTSYARGQTAAPYQPQPPVVETARHLSLIARRFANDNASCQEMEEAIAMWQAEARKKWPIRCAKFIDSAAGRQDGKREEGP